MKKKMMKKMVLRRLVMFNVLLIMGLGLTSCGKKVEKDITFYNMTPYSIEQITLATENTRSDDEKKIAVLDYGEEAIEGEGTCALIFSVPEKELKESWFLHIQGGDGSSSFGTEEEIGTIFTDKIDGVEILFDEVEQKFVYTVIYE